MNHLEQKIDALRRKIERDCRELAKLEAERGEYARQRRERQSYLSSREIVELVRRHTGKSPSLSTVKRWADERRLGDVVEERARFPLLARSQGNKRFLYPKAAVYDFLFQKGVLRPRYDVLDRVAWHDVPGGGTEWAVVVQWVWRDGGFRYTLQTESTGKVVHDVCESRLLDEEERWDPSP